jgi:tetratricopeptide (TPR) repeat protein
MKKKKKERVMILIIALPLLMVFVALLTWMYFEGKPFRYAGLEADKLGEVEHRYQREPNLKDCVFLTNRYGYVLKNYSKGLKYAEQCLELDDTPERFKFRIYFWLADLNHKADNMEKAKENLRIAIQMDKEGEIEKNNWIEKDGLETIYYEVKNSP